MSDSTPTRARGEGLSARRSFHATRCEAQVVECCHGRQCEIPPSAVSDERRALSPASERARDLARIARAAPAPHTGRSGIASPTGAFLLKEPPYVSGIAARAA